MEEAVYGQSINYTTENNLFRPLASQFSTQAGFVCCIVSMYRHFEKRSVLIWKQRLIKNNRNCKINVLFELFLNQFSGSKFS